MLTGVAPIPGNSDQFTTRYRLNRYGDRQLKNALPKARPAEAAAVQAAVREESEGREGGELRSAAECSGPNPFAIKQIGRLTSSNSPPGTTRSIPVPALMSRTPRRSRGTPMVSDA
jgi:hypothetical protein